MKAGGQSAVDVAAAGAFGGGTVAVPVDVHLDLAGDVVGGAVHIPMFGHVNFRAGDLRVIGVCSHGGRLRPEGRPHAVAVAPFDVRLPVAVSDRKSTRLNSSHLGIS